MTFQSVGLTPNQMTTVNLILKSPPGVNSLYYTRIVPAKYPKKGSIPIRGLTTEGQEYKRHVAEVAGGLTPFIGDVAVSLRWYRPRRSGDIDGILKIILDGISGHIYNDDKQIARLVVDRFEDKLRPRVEIEIKALELC